VTGSVILEAFFIDDSEASPAEVPVVETFISIIWEYEMKGFRYRYLGKYKLKRLKPLICSLLAREVDGIFCHTVDGFYCFFIS